MSETRQDAFKSSITKCPDGKYRVDYSYRSPDGKRHRTCKRGFKLQREATKWQREELPKLIKQLGQEKTLDEEQVLLKISPISFRVKYVRFSTQSGYMQSVKMMCESGRINCFL